MIVDFHAYERALCLQGLAPLLRKRAFDAAGKSVLDVGCGYGGVLSGLKEMFPLKEALGIDLDAVMVRNGARKCPPGVRLEVMDFFAMPARGFDLILMRDVLEHIPDAQAALEKAASMLNAGGLLFVSFAPFYSPFGGHQHNGSGFFSNVPWLQFLPESWFRAALRLRGNSYKSGKGLSDDMESVLRTRLTLSGFRRMAPAAGLRFRYFARYLSRPDYRIKFGIPEIGFPPIPLLDDLVCTGVEALLDKAAPRGDTSYLWDSMIPDNLILNADDFGLHPRVSSGIARCLDEGLINSFSVFPFRDGFHADLLKSILARHPGVKVGAHLALVDAGLPEHRGHFRDFLSRYLTGRMPPAKVMALWRAQIEALAGHLGEAGGVKRIAHLDSHQHLHVLPGLWPVARALQREFRIPRLRVPYESLRRGLTHRFPFGLGMQALAFLRADGGTPGFIGFHSSTRFTLKANHAALEQVLLQPGRRFELMVHPAIPEENLPESLNGGGREAARNATSIAPSQEREIAELRLVSEFFDRSAWA